MKMKTDIHGKWFQYLLIAPMSILCGMNSMAQNSKVEDSIYLKVDALPGFIGDTSWAGFLQKNMVYPEKLRLERFKGTFVFSFIVNTDSSVSNVFCYTGCNLEPLYLKEAMRLLSLSNKRWTPAKAGNRYVRYRTKISVSFENPGDLTIYSKVDTEPLFMGKPASDAFADLDTDSDKKLVFSFVVNKDGSISDLSYDSSYKQYPVHLEEVISLLLNTSGRWQPATFKKRKVRYRVKTYIPTFIDTSVFSQSLKTQNKIGEQHFTKDSIDQKSDSLPPVFIGTGHAWRPTVPYFENNDSFTGTFIVTFYINTDSTVSDISYDSSYNQYPVHLKQAIGVIMSTNKQWVPARVGKRYVRHRVTIPISFEYEEDE